MGMSDFKFVVRYPILYRKQLLEPFQKKQRGYEGSVEENSGKHEDWTKCENPAIKGLNSNWINDSIIASQRPSDRLIEKYKIIQQFKEHNVKAIFNLEEPGEHANCGDGLVSKNIGFSYTPELLQKNGISCYFFNWRDMTNPKINDILKNVKLMDMHIAKGDKVLVHCHAGQGRTAVIIAAYLMYKNITNSVDDTITFIRSQRYKGLKKEYNREFLSSIELEYEHYRQIFPKKNHHFRLSVDDIISNQLKFFHGPERVKYKHIPKIMDMGLVKLYQLLERGSYDHDEIIDSFLLIEDMKKKNNNEEVLEKVKEDLNKGKWDEFINQSSDPKILAQLFLDFGESLAAPIITVNGLKEVDLTFKKSMSAYSNYDENKDKKALHEIFEDGAKVNPKKVIFHIVGKMLGFLRLFNGYDNQDLLIDRMLVALMQKKKLYKESSFIARSMISTVNDEDQEINMMSNVFTSILGHEDFVEFNMSPFPKKRHIKDMHAFSVSNRKDSYGGINATEKRVQNFLGYISNMVR